MKVVIEGHPKEIAALVVALQERQREKFSPSDSSSEDSVTNKKCSC